MKFLAHRVLNEYQLSPAQWEVISTAGFYLPIPFSLFIAQVQLRSDEGFADDEIAEAVDTCIKAGLIVICHGDHGLVLSDTGHYLKEQINQELMETVELV